MLAAALREHPPPPGAAALDVCTGSGLLAVQAALLGARVTAVDVMRRALLSARANARLNGVRVRTCQGSLFDGLDGERFDTIVSNPPYVPAPREELPARGPQRAWDAGRDGRALLGPRGVDGLARGDREEPGAHRGPVAHLLVGPKRREHGVLKDVLGPAGAGLGGAEAKQRRAVRL